MPTRPGRKERLQQLLESGRAYTKEDIRHILHLRSLRHVQRLLRHLREEGLPIQEERRGRTKYYFLPESHLSAGCLEMDLTEDEALAMALAIQAAAPVLGPSPYGEALNRVYQKLLSSGITRAFSFDPEALSRHWHFLHPEQAQFDRDVLRTLQQAILEQCSVRINYYAASSRRWTYNRKIDPLTLVFFHGSWLLVAYCHLRKAIRDFSLGGIQRVECCDPEREAAYFQVPEGFNASLYFRDRFGVVADEEVYVIRLRVHPEAAPYFKRKLYHPTQQIEAEEAEGALIVSYEVEGLEEIAAFVRSWGSRVEVLEPEALRENILQEARNTLARYAPS